MYNFIVNPNSQSGNGLKIWKKLEGELINRNVKYMVHFTKRPKHASQIARELTKDNKKTTIIILGGDGTTNEVINGIENPDTVTLGYIPTGSCNDFARGYGLPLKPLDALDVVLNNAHYIRPVDNGVVVTDNGSTKFCSNGGFGFDAVISQKALKSKLKKFLNRIKLGKLIYVFILLKELFFYKPMDATVTIDDKTYLFNRLYFVAFTIHPYEGGGMKICPDANPFDQKIDLCVVYDIPKLKILTLFPLIFLGKHVNLKGVKVFQGHNATIKMSKPTAVHTDGESYGKHKSLSLKCTPDQVKLILNK
ncbi:YegS/Rv2252/BmrU family lipid kinase [Natranaerovirga pectinivora]|uniref:YegS/Rv2252/BmrU family lipid kinase n=1 Tax=Natranaerovirga pectinivora TaxID=682400 RepID=A0A4R3MMT8_9FIRM|nr:diacylglycerol kinase family protein [Natranaerovirga pectinivora]TCT16293.1 YegS/Rv2252/BmrU family lipid kinase [Natranaerovirga pectinivora]